MHFLTDKAQAEEVKILEAMCMVLHVATAAQVVEYKYEIERLTRELAGLKKKYFEAKKREQLDKEAARGAAAAGALGSAAGLMGMLGAASAGSTAGGKAPPGGQQQQSQQQRFTGGGFSLSTVVG